MLSRKNQRTNSRKRRCLEETSEKIREKDVANRAGPTVSRKLHSLRLKDGESAQENIKIMSFFDAFSVAGKFFKRRIE